MNKGCFFVFAWNGLGVAKGGEFFFFPVTVFTVSAFVTNLRLFKF